MRKWLASFGAALVLLFGQGVQQAQALSFPTTPSGMLCPDAGFWNELIGGVCWSSIFPMMIAGKVAWSGGQQAPSDAYSGSPVCYCCGSVKQGQLPRAGIPVGFWQPSMLVEAVSRPFCMPVLGGLYAGGSGLNGVLFSGAVGGEGQVGGANGGDQAGYWNVHQWTYPLVSMLNMLNIPDCGTGYNGMNLLDFSEVQPQWNDDLTAELIWPESAVLAGPIGTFGAVGECLKEIPPFFGQPIDQMYWTAGCWGELFPPDGDIASGSNAIVGSNLAAAKFLSAEYRLGNGVQTMGQATLCGPKYTAVMPKSMYRWQMIYPNNEGTRMPNIPANGSASGGDPKALDNQPQPSMLTSDNVNTTLSPAQQNKALKSMFNGQSCTHWTGQPDLTWGSWLGQPGTGDNFVYIVFQWTDCCIGVIGGNMSQ